MSNTAAIAVMFIFTAGWLMVAAATGGLAFWITSFLCAACLGVRIDYAEANRG